MSGRLREISVLGERIPPGPEGWLRELGGPCFFSVAGTDCSRTRIVVTLMHGNEPSGFHALHRWLRTGTRPATSLLCILPGVEAALTAPLFSHRIVPGRRDLNRCFGAPAADGNGEIAAEVLELVDRSAAEALIDLHNNTGHSPPYAIATGVDRARLALGSLFASIYVHSDLDMGAMMESMEGRVRGVTIECGRAGSPAADDLALAGLCAFAEREELPAEPVQPMRLLERPLRVEVRLGTRLVFANQPVAEADLTVSDDIDRHAFAEIPADHSVGWARDGDALPVVAHGADGRDHAPELFCVRNGELLTRRAIIPVMMTTSVRAALEDCLFYVVEETEGGRR